MNIKPAVFPAIILAAALSASSAAAPRPQQTNADQANPFKNLKFRNLGPAVAGGRVTSVAGIPGEPDTYYVGAAAGGVFKTEDGGNSWKAIFKDEATASVGAVALAPSNPNLLWVGTGEANLRNDIIDGRGVYFSPDAGQSWRFMGLPEAGQIAKIVIDPTNPQIVLVAAVGHAWGPNPERGVFRTTDGGLTWRKVLFVNDTTGCADLVMQPDNPMVLLAAMWQVRRYPWQLVSGGDASGIYRSTDGGQTWKKLTKDLPEDPLGRIALAIAPSAPRHVYALIESKKGLLWESNDLGDGWTMVSDNHQLNVRPFYFSQMVVSPVNDRKIFFLSFWLVVSDDGGKTAHIADRGVHPDHHALWIDPENPDRMIQGNDGGVYLSTDGAASWRFLGNLPIEQFYMVAADTGTPYNLCGGLQDNNAWCGPSNSLSGAGIIGPDWYVVTGGDGEYAVPAPSDPDIIYTDAQNGYISRFDRTTRFSQFIRPYLPGVEEMKPADLKYRFNWTSPIAVSYNNADEVYLGANVVFKSVNGGAEWTPISGDLTRNDKSKQVISGGPVEYDISGAETYDTILSITLAPTDPEVIWVGTDDGLVQVTRDGGKTWTDVTPNIPDAPEWARVYQIGVSAFDAGSAFLSFDAHMLDDRRPYVYKTADYGKTWTKISEGLPGDTPVVVVRENPNRRGFLVAGTETGLFFSPDGGSEWKPLKADFPTAPVWDLKFVGKTHDLVVATHGRGLFVLDNIRPLEEFSPEVASGDFHLFSPAPGILYNLYDRGISSVNSFAAPNPPNGVELSYFLKEEISSEESMKKQNQTPVKITITDTKGNHVATRYGPSLAGVDRYVWNMRYDGPKELDFIERPEPGQFSAESAGPPVLAGSYKATVEVKGQSQSQTVEVQPDPRLTIAPSVFRTQTDTALRLRNDLSALNEMLNRIDAMQKSLTAFQSSVDREKEAQGPAASKYGAVVKEAKALGEKLTELKDSVFNPEVQRNVIEDDIHYLTRFHGQLQNLYYGLAFAYAQAPTPPTKSQIEAKESALAGYLERFNSLLGTDVVRYNKTAYENGAPTLMTGPPIKVETTPLP